MRLWFDLLPPGDHFAFFGSLLGPTRTGRLLPWTSDNDLYVDEALVRRLSEPKSTLKATLREHGLSVFSDTIFSRLCITTDWQNDALRRHFPSTFKPDCFPRLWYPLHFVYTDLFTYHIDAAGVLRGQLSCNFTTDLIFPLRKLPLNYAPANSGSIPDGVHLPPPPTLEWIAAPHHVRALLERVYGPTWSIPDGRRARHGDSKCRSGG